ncbi:unnamed protein product [Coregonus sp. 'balchen']|nr:unnamed protein product [Coregonus sp. 'balchen']
MMLSLYLHSKDPTFYGEFDNNTRFAAENNGDGFVLTISDAKPSDVGMYYCAARVYDYMIFGNGVFLMHKGIIYTHGDRSDQCEKSPEAGSPTQSCVYNLPKRNLSLSDTGTYYCAVASCGEILFGNGTKLEIKDEQESMSAVQRTRLSDKRASSLDFGYKGINYTHQCDQCEKSPEAGSPTQSCVYNLPKRNLSLSDAGTYYCALHGDDDGLNYTALRFTDKKSTNPRRQRREQRKEETIYSGVSNQERM